MSHLRNHFCRAATARPLVWRSQRTIFSTSRRSSIQQHSPRSHAYPIMATIGACILAYTMYNVYDVLTLWPEVLRDDLRQGIKYRNQRNLPLSIQHLQQVWESAKSLPLTSFGSDPLLKTSGIAIVLAGVLEDVGKKEEAYNVYKEALWQLQSTHLHLPPDDEPQPDLGGMESLKLLTPQERMRAAALAHKLGGLASKLRKPEKEEEKWLTCAVNSILMSVMEAPAGSEKVPPRAKNLHFMAADMGLPSWAKDHDIAAPFEALGNFYAQRGNTFYALPLYLQAISILIPIPPLESSPEDRCRGAQLMRDVSLVLAMSGGPDAIPQAISWIQKGLDVVIATRQSRKGKGKTECDSAYMILLCDLAKMHKIWGDHDKARELFQTVVKEGKAMDIKKVVEFGEDQLQKLDSDKRGNKNETL